MLPEVLFLALQARVYQLKINMFTFKVPLCNSKLRELFKFRKLSFIYRPIILLFPPQIKKRVLSASYSFCKRWYSSFLRLLTLILIQSRIKNVVIYICTSIQDPGLHNCSLIGKKSPWIALDTNCIIDIK